MGGQQLYTFIVKGEPVSLFADRHMAAGRIEITWNGIDEEGRAAASGVYFYYLIAGDFVQTKKMALFVMQGLDRIEF